jgi:hypothetical protein
MVRFLNSAYTAEISRITGTEKPGDIAINAILAKSYKENSSIFQSAYTAQNRSISKIGLQYIQG